ncbi:MAG: helix-turn-helix transcriptional regulator [Oscillospiraceae bacterium]|nr:helix-turn-helix transcriptional regulator [Oscillospiraceae bacterium]
MRSICPVETTLSLIGGKYKALILWHLSAGTLRFNQLQKAVTATPRMLTLQLRELENDGLISRTVYPEVPPRVEYAMTDLGRSLMPILTAIRDWGAEYLRGKDIEPNCFMMRGDAPAGNSF